jgi:hypothetical protein
MLVNVPQLVAAYFSGKPDARHYKAQLLTRRNGPIAGLSLSETQSCWQLISNRAMLLPYATGLQPILVSIGRSVPVAGLA